MSGCSPSPQVEQTIMTLLLLERELKSKPSMSCTSPSRPYALASLAILAASPSEFPDWDPNRRTSERSPDDRRSSSPSTDSPPSATESSTGGASSASDSFTASDSAGAPPPNEAKIESALAVNSAAGSSYSTSQSTRSTTLVAPCFSNQASQSFPDWQKNS